MTEKEAIKTLRFVMNNLNCGTKTAESYDMAISALEKQIPKKPKHKGCYDADGVWHEWNGVRGKPYELCPNCEINLCCEMPYDKKLKYCENCGQKLDWGDDE